MADEIERFEYQRFLPEENRGGTYNVTLNIGGKIVGPMTPKDADARGFPLSKIFAGIDTQVMYEVASLREHVAAAEAKLAELETKTEALAVELIAAKEAATVSLGGELVFSAPGELVAKDQTAEAVAP